MELNSRYLISACLILMSSYRTYSQPVSDANGTTSSTNTISGFSLPAGDDRLVVACMTFLTGTPTMTFDGNSMTLAATGEEASLDHALFYRIEGSSASATTGDIVASASLVYHIAASSFHNVDQSSPVDGASTTNFSDQTSSSLSITSEINDLVCDCVGGFQVSSDVYTTTPGGGQSKLWEGAAGEPTELKTSASHEDGAASVSMDWTFTEPVRGVHMGMNLNAASVLPVELLFFDAKIDGNRVRLSWETATETNNDKFEIEHSLDGMDFQKIGEVKGKGTTLNREKYTFEINLSSIGFSYYRLKQIDFNGQFSYSPIVQTEFRVTEEKVGFLYPIPHHNGLVYLDYTSPRARELSISVMDLKGQRHIHQLRSLSAGYNLLDFNFANLPSGIYLVKIGNDSFPFYRKLLLK